MRRILASGAFVDGGGAGLLRERAGARMARPLDALPDDVARDSASSDSEGFVGGSGGTIGRASSAPPAHACPNSTRRSQSRRSNESVGAGSSPSSTPFLSLLVG